MNPVIVVGGYGVFGGWVCRELAARGIGVTVAGRNGEKAAAFARQLGSSHDGVTVDLNRPETLRSALRGRTVAVNCAGPFQQFDATFLEACLNAGCQYADIADDRRYAALVRKYDESYKQRRLCAAYGCSSLPAISGALALMLCVETRAKPIRARVTLFVGNDNEKGVAAVLSSISGLNRPIAAPQGVIVGGRGREVVPFPAPFGRRAVLNVDSPEYDLFPALLGVDHVTVKLGLELRIGTEMVAWLASTGLHFGRRTTALMTGGGKWVRRFGCSGGVVMTELFFGDGSRRRAALVVQTDGQRIAALPCAIVTQALLDGSSARVGACTAYELLGAETLLRQLQVAMPGLRLIMR